MALGDFGEPVENADLGDTSLGDFGEVGLVVELGENPALLRYPLGDLEPDGDLGENRFLNFGIIFPADLPNIEADCPFEVALVIVTVPGSTIDLLKSISLCLALYFSAISFNLKASFIFPTSI